MNELTCAHFEFLLLGPFPTFTLFMEIKRRAALFRHEFQINMSQFFHP